MKFHTPRKKVLHPDYHPCAGCGVKPFTGYMIHDELWNEVSQGDNLLCLSCFTARLGRPLELTDFKPCQLTNLILLGASIATGEKIDMTEGYKSEPKPYFRMIGDMHGEIGQYIRLAGAAQHSIQVGDLGFDYGGVEVLDPTKHRFVGGNHDNYTTIDGGFTFCNMPPHYLGDFGLIDLPGIPKTFFMRGARSVDKESRIVGVTWWEDEELRYRRMNEAIQAFSDLKPEMVISHECPAFLVNEVTRWKVPLKPSNTAFALEAMFTNHQPKVWIFGHFHNDWSMTFKGTYFRCLDIQSTLDMDGPFEADQVEATGKLTSLNLGGK